MRNRQVIMKNSSVKLVWILVVVASIFLSTTTLPNHQGAYAQDSPSTTNATVLSGNDTISQSGQRNQSISYFDGSSGYLVYPEMNNATSTSGQQQQQKLPAVVMIHEWWGLNDHIKDMADELASEGYVVLAADLYNGEVAADPGRARELSSSVRENPEQAISNLQSAVKYLASLPNVNSSRIASLGWCFGGGQSLQLALNSEQNPLAATVIYYGNLVNDSNELSKIDWTSLRCLR
jgi:carboxymethylenebutenolidase